MINYTVNNFRGGHKMYSNILRPLIIVIAIVSISEVAFSQNCPDPPKKVYFLRHAHKCEDSSAYEVKISCDPGHKMAKDLVRKIESMEEGARGNAKVSAIYTTDYPRTKQTAAPLAEKKRIEPKVIEKGENSLLIDKICNVHENETIDDHKNEIILVVGHSDTVPDIVSRICPYGTNNCSAKSSIKAGYCDLFIVEFNNNSPRLIDDEQYCSGYTYPTTAPCMTESWCPTTNSE